MAADFGLTCGSRDIACDCVWVIRRAFGHGAAGASILGQRVILFRRSMAVIPLIAIFSLQVPTVMLTAGRPPQSQGPRDYPASREPDYLILLRNGAVSHFFALAAFLDYLRLRVDITPLTLVPGRVSVCPCPRALSSRSIAAASWGPFALEGEGGASGGTSAGAGPAFAWNSGKSTGKESLPVLANKKRDWLVGIATWRVKEICGGSGAERPIGESYQKYVSGLQTRALKQNKRSRYGRQHLRSANPANGTSTGIPRNQHAASPPPGHPLDSPILMAQ